MSGPSVDIKKRRTREPDSTRSLLYPAWTENETATTSKFLLLGGNSVDLIEEDDTRLCLLCLMKNLPDSRLARPYVLV